MDLALQCVRVLCAKAHDHERADVAAHGLQQGGRQLRQILVRERQSNAEFARLGKHRRERFRHEMLELVDVEEERRSARRAAHCRQLDGRQEQAAEQPACVFTDPADGQVGDQHAGVVHELPDVELAPPLRDDPADWLVADERAELVQDRRQRFSLELWPVARELDGPELLDDGVLDARRDVLSQLVLGQEAIEEEQRRARVGDDGQDGAAEHMLKPRSPHVGPVFSEDRDEAGCDQIRVQLAPALAEHVEGDGVIAVGRVEHAGLVRAGLGNQRKGGQRQIPVRVEHADAAASGQVLRDESEKQR